MRPGGDWDIPRELPLLGHKAAQAIFGYAKRTKLTHTGGCKVFYSPDEWKARKEEYGTNSLLIVVYDGGDHRLLFEEQGRPAALRRMQKILEGLGVWVQPCTSWYCAIYPLNPPEETQSP